MLKRFFILVLMVLVATVAYAEAPLPIANSNAQFDVTAANNELDKVSIKLSTQDLRLNDMLAAIESLELLKSKADNCVTDAKAQVKNINELLGETKAIDDKPNDNNADQQFLNDKKNTFSKKLSDCQLFVYRVNEALTAYKKVATNMSATKIVRQSAPVWEIFDLSVLNKFIEFDRDKLYKQSGIAQFTPGKSIVIILFIILATLIANIIRNILTHWLAKQKHASMPVCAMITTMTRFIIPLTALAAFCLCLATMMNGEYLETIVYNTVFAGFAFLLIFSFSKFVFSPPGELDNIIGLPKPISQSLHHRLITLASWITLGYLTMLYMNTTALTDQEIELFKIAFVTVLSLLLVAFLWVFSRLPALCKSNHSRPFYIKSILIFLLLATLTAEWVGFHRLAIFIVTGLSLSILLLGIAYVLCYLVEITYTLLTNERYTSASKFRRFFGIRPHRVFPEMVLLKFSGYISVITVSFIYFISIWSTHVNLHESLLEALIDGFKIYGLNVNPVRALFALVIFSLLLLLGRFISTIISTHYHGSKGKDTQVAIASISFYISFTIALLISLLITGINFTGLAIIAGALSVGAGLGLQDIVNNFVSGLVLLLEKPIKPGDRIIIGETEGFVKKIRIRSTQICTLSREDVIVPNADLVSNQVTNYMFRDEYWRVICPVGIAYGSNVDLARDCLLQVANENPDVLKEPPNEPAVLFREFGDSSLNFELWCIINNVNDKFKVQSELNFAINKIFKDHDITIAFPQRDIHIKSGDLPSNDD